MKKVQQDYRVQKEDRRGWNAAPEYPFIDSNNVKVFEDRRVRAERRGCELKEIMPEDVEIQANVAE